METRASPIIVVCFGTRAPRLGARGHLLLARSRPHRAPVAHPPSGQHGDGPGRALSRLACAHRPVALARSAQPRSPGRQGRFAPLRDWRAARQPLTAGRPAAGSCVARGGRKSGSRRGKISATTAHSCRGGNLRRGPHAWRPAPITGLDERSPRWQCARSKARGMLALSPGNREPPSRFGGGAPVAHRGLPWWLQVSRRRSRRPQVASPPSSVGWDADSGTVATVVVSRQSARHPHAILLGQG